MRAVTRWVLAGGVGVLLFAGAAAGRADAQVGFGYPYIDRFPTPYTPYRIPYPFPPFYYDYHPALFYNRAYYLPYYPMSANYPVGPGNVAASPAAQYGIPGEIRVALPVADAKLTLNGEVLNGSGYNRRLGVTLRPGEEHSYTVTATWNEHGKPVTKKRTVKLSLFDRQGLANFFVPQENE